MKSILDKIADTLDVIIPFTITVLSTLSLTGIVSMVDKWVPVAYGLLGAIATVGAIWTAQPGYRERH
jgi:hypothetical protein